jgi:hypothetical protein
MGALHTEHLPANARGTVRGGGVTLEQAQESICLYVAHGLHPGGFLTAVLSNDLFGAIGRADDSSLDNLQKIVRHVYNDIPGDCWGSPAKVNGWLEFKRSGA